jgi:hypothetical protein
MIDVMSLEHAADSVNLGFPQPPFVRAAVAVSKIKAQTRYANCMSPSFTA